MRAIRAVGSGPLRVIISHENITPLKMAQNRLKDREEELKQKTAYLEEANAALRAILRQRDEDRQEMEQAILKNVRECILPYCESLKLSRQTNENRQLIELIESGLNEVTSPFLRRLSNLETVLTPHEIQIASFIKEGKSTKDIAGLLNVSMNTVKFHRRNLRDKLGLKNTASNLRAFLMSLKE
jgi:DNA-binding NarL/FixJ family response regulator